jgi:hypothetical protein
MEVGYVVGERSNDTSVLIGASYGQGWPGEPMVLWSTPLSRVGHNHTDDHSLIVLMQGKVQQFPRRFYWYGDERTYDGTSALGGLLGFFEGR